MSPRTDVRAVHRQARSRAGRVRWQPRSSAGATNCWRSSRFWRRCPPVGRRCCLEGDAGIGKTVLWEEALRLAGERGFRVLRSRPTQSEAQVAFAAVGDLLAPALSGGLQRLAPVQRHALETALLIREPDGVFPDTRVLGVALLSTVRALAEERPVLVALDDAQWLDASSARGAHVHASTAGRRRRWPFSRRCAGSPLRRRSNSTARSPRSGGSRSSRSRSGRSIGCCGAGWGLRCRGR